MDAHQIMVFEYAAMIGIPMLLVLTSLAYAFALTWAFMPLGVLLVLALFVYGVLSFVEVFVHGAARGSLEGKIEGKTFFKVARLPGKSIERITFSVKRFDPHTKALRTDTYSAEADGHTNVLDALINIKDNVDPSLSMRYSCRMGICGSCGMNVNGKPALACETNVMECQKNGVVEVSPMLGHPLLKDLVTDFDDFFEKHKALEPHLFRENAMEKYRANRIYKQNPEQEDKFLPFSYCIMCGLCLDACPVVNSNPSFIGPQSLSQTLRYRADSRDQMGGKRLDLVDSLEGVWGCEFIGACSDACPKGVDPALAIQMLKGDIMKDKLLGGGKKP